MVIKSTISVSELNAYTKIPLEQSDDLNKIFETENEYIFKLFRQRKLISGNRLYPYGKRFANNAKQIQLYGMPTIHIEFCKRLQGTMTYFVKYKKLPGLDVRTFLEKNASENLWKDLAKFLAALHDKGIFFRGIHLGNLLLLDNGEFTLLDFARVKFYKKSLSTKARIRNLQHMMDYRDDVDHFAAIGKENFLKLYFEYAGLTEKQQQKIQCKLFG